jgi:hypothetical protein
VGAGVGHRAVDVERLDRLPELGEVGLDLLAQVGLLLLVDGLACVCVWVGD